MHEGALGATNDNPHTGRTHNPRRHGHTPGGSSGGSAAAVAAGLCPLALGTDTMGSVRLPAAYCGIAGFKPTRGLLANDGIEPLCRRLDQVGPLAASAAGLALAFEALTGRALPARLPEIEGLRLGHPTDLDSLDLDDDVRRAFENAVYRLWQAGAAISELPIAALQPGRLRRAGLLLAEAEAAAWFAADREHHPAALSGEFCALLDYGAATDRSRLDEAERRIEQGKGDVTSLFETIDLLILPTAPQTAFPFDEAVPPNQADLTVLASVAGLPALSLPIPSADLPVGLQLVGRRDADDLVLGTAMRLECELGFAYRDPAEEAMW